ncbi:hypothetical protein C8F04DRAFT_1176872 [Mycena alexandri]|uniref:Uncharacterized protein n=1 Tax=Mycena alexandri TaxID=1745969 RepID=A0AAD6X7E2_9AGAR|nr:hypothetical protein C8F04DRAFT_1176872 [Mycena alexandri]
MHSTPTTSIKPDRRTTKRLRGATDDQPGPFPRSDSPIVSAKKRYGGKKARTARKSTREDRESTAKKAAKQEPINDGRKGRVAAMKGKAGDRACTKARMKTTSFLSIPNLFKGQRETRIRESTLSSEWYSTPMTAESQWDTSYLMPNKASLRERCLRLNAISGALLKNNEVELGMTLPATGLSSTGGLTAHRESISPTGEHQPYGRQSQLKLSFGPPGDPSGFTVEPLECNSDQRTKMSPVANDVTEFRLK